MSQVQVPLSNVKMRHFSNVLCGCVSIDKSSISGWISAKQSSDDYFIRHLNNYKKLSTNSICI